MATATMVPIATQTLGSAAASITFNSIPGTYTDLRLVLTGTSSGADVPEFQLNGDTGTNYSFTRLIANGSAASSTNSTGATFVLIQSTNFSTTVPSTFSLDLFSYAGSTNKTVLVTSANDQNGSGNVEMEAALWRSTAAITSIVLKFNGGNNFATGTIATLFGI